MKQNEPTASSPSPRRIIERPRLIKQLDETDAHTILLIAPAGYGKTTLARQWCKEKRATALTVSISGSEVTVLARSWALGLSDQVPRLPRSVEEAIRVSPMPSRQAQNLARAFLGEVSEPLDRWFAIDDYHLLKPGSPAAILVETLEASGFFRLLITSRARPSFATARRRLYGEVVEITQAELAFDDKEATEFLCGHEDTPSLQQAARGWPALVALGALADSPATPPTAEGTATLYDFFAEEIFSRASQQTQYSLLRLAVLPALDRESATIAIGDAQAVEDAVRTGVAYETSGIIEVHPLARNFLLAKIVATADLAPIVAEGITFTLANGCWNEAFELIRRFERPEYLDALITSSYLALTEAGRVATLASFGAYAVANGGLSQALLDLIDAEVAYRDGLFERARSLGLAAAAHLPDDHPLKARCYLISGQGAQLDWRLEEAFQVFNSALAVSQRSRDANDASWGRCLTAVFLEDERLREAIEEMGTLLNPTAEDRLRLLMGRQSVGRLFDGLYDLARDVAVADSLLPDISDPIVRTGWGNTHGYTLLLQGRYDEASLVLNTALVDIEKYALEFGRPHIQWSLAAANLGLRQFARADALLRRVEAKAVQRGSTYLHLNTRALRARLLLCQRRVDEAVGLTDSEFAGAPRDAMYGEYVATRALALALAQRSDEALVAASDAIGFTRAVEAHVLAAAARAVVAAGTDHAESATDDLFSTASTLGAWDGFICAVRSSPPLLTTLAKSDHRALLVDVLGRSHDAALSYSSGLTNRRPRGTRGLLSRREAEVLDLLCQGLKTREMAAALYIADSTVKVHVRNVLQKLDARTRAEAVARYTDATTSFPESTPPADPTSPGASS